MKNRNKILIILIPVMIMLLAVSASDILWSKSPQNPNFKLRKVKNEAFNYGEKLEYKVGYKFITAGNGSIEIMPKPIVRQNRNSYDVRFQVSSLKSLEWLYRINNQYRSVIDVDGIFTWEFQQRNREGNYRRDFRAVFDQVNNFATVKEKVYPVPEYTQDIISAFFYVRTMDLASMPNGTKFSLNNFVDDSTYTLGVQIHRRETVTVDAGTFDCIVIEPLVVEGGLFKSEGSILIWLTNDERKIPVKVATRILIGFVSAELTGYSGLSGKIRAKK
jgi:hypothetical protein